MAKRGLDTKWDPLKGKKVLVDRLQVRGGKWLRGVMSCWLWFQAAWVFTTC
jgi:hypothetical protein